MKKRELNLFESGIILSLIIILLFSIYLVIGGKLDSILSKLL